MGKHYGLDIPTLRELRIDVDKEWVDEDGQSRGISKLKEVAAAMAQGAVAYRGPDFLLKLAANYGIGYNFLHAQNTGIDEPGWMDIQELIAYITGGVNRMIAPPTLVIPAPSIGVEAAAASSPPGKTVDKTLTIPAPSVSLSEMAILDQRYESGDDSDLSVWGVNWEAQTFTVNVAHDIEIIEIKCRRVLSPGDITIGIRATAAGLPTGADLTSVTFSGNDLPTSDTWITKYLTAHGLSAATKYAIVIRAPSGDVSNYLVWRSDGTAPAYAGGARCHSANSGVDWAEDLNSDFMFREGEVK